MENKFESGKDIDHLVSNMNFEKVLPEKKVKKKIMKDAESERAKAVDLAENWLNENKDFNEMPLKDQQAIVRDLNLTDQSEHFIIINNFGLKDSQTKTTLADYFNDSETQQRIRLIIEYEKNIFSHKSQDLGENQEVSKKFIREFRQKLANESPDDEIIRNYFAEYYLEKNISQACQELGLSNIKLEMTSGARDNLLGQDLALILGNEIVYVDLTMTKNEMVLREKEEKLVAYQARQVNSPKPEIVMVFSPLYRSSEAGKWEAAIQHFLADIQKRNITGNNPFSSPKQVLSAFIDGLERYFAIEGKILNKIIPLSRLAEVKHQLALVRNSLTFDNKTK